MILNTIICGMIGGPQLIVILVIVLLLFGGKKIPELMKGIGKGVRAYKDGLNEIEKDMNETNKAAAAAKEVQKESAELKETEKAAK